MTQRALREKLKFTRAQIRTAAIIAKEQGVNVRLDADGSLSVQPATPGNLLSLTTEERGIVRL